MKKRNLFYLCCAAALIGCQPNTDNNKTLDFDSLQVNFKASIKGQEWSADDKVTVLATCTRDGQADYSMSDNVVATYNIATPGAESNLIAATDADKAVALKSDHSFHFYGIFPCPTGTLDLTSIPVSVPTTQKYSEALTKRLTFLGSATTLTVIPTINLEMSTIFSVIEFYIPSDLREGEESTIMSLEITPTDEGSFKGYIAESGSYNAKDDIFTVNGAKSANKITVDFGTSGLPLVASFTKVAVAVSPMTIPVDGLTLKFLDKDGTETTVKALASDKEVGNEIKAGDTYVSYVSGSSDGIIPVNFPVIFPIGYPDGDKTKTGYCNAANTWMTEWVNDPACVSSTRTTEMWTGHHGTVYCSDQTQAYVTWNWAEDINVTGTKHFIETANTANYLISTFGVKGVWTNDYFEFVIPVKKFKAGSKVTLTMPLYTRSGPTFWEVLYKDGEVWKSTAVDNLPAYEGATVTRRATWAIPFGGTAASASIDTDQEITMEFANEIKSGYLYIRVKCVDGSIVSNASNSVSEVTTPSGGATANAPFYFWNPSPAKRPAQAITIEVK